MSDLIAALVRVASAPPTGVTMILVPESEDQLAVVRGAIPDLGPDYFLINGRDAKTHNKLPCQIDSIAVIIDNKIKCEINRPINLDNVKGTGALIFGVTCYLYRPIDDQRSLAFEEARRCLLDFGSGTRHNVMIRQTDPNVIAHTILFSAIYPQLNEVARGLQSAFLVCGPSVDVIPAAWGGSIMQRLDTNLTGTNPSYMTLYKRLIYDIDPVRFLLMALQPTLRQAMKSPILPDKALIDITVTPMDIVRYYSVVNEYIQPTANARDIYRLYDVNAPAPRGSDISDTHGQFSIENLLASYLQHLPAYLAGEDVNEVVISILTIDLLAFMYDLATDFATTDRTRMIAQADLLRILDFGYKPEELATYCLNDPNARDRFMGCFFMGRHTNRPLDTWRKNKLKSLQNATRECRARAATIENQLDEMLRPKRGGTDTAIGQDGYGIGGGGGGRFHPQILRTSGGAPSDLLRYLRND